MRVRNRLEAVRKADRLLEALRSADELAATAARSGSVSDIPVLLQTVESSDQVMAIAAIHALACIPDPEVDEALMGMLTHEQGFVREHSVWALGSRAPRIEAVGPLIYMVVTGGFTGMLSQRTLEEWAKAAPATVAARLESALAEVVDPAQRFRLVETLGLVPGSAVAVQLARIAGDVGEGLLARVAAVSALGDQVPAPTECALLEQLTQLDGVLAEVAKLALADIKAAVIASNASDGGGAVDPAGTKIGGGLTIAQLFLHADIDPELSNAGNGDNGGIATLLVRLGDALVGTSDRLGDEVSLGGVERVPVTRVLTLSRGDIHEAAQNLEVLRKGLAGHVYARIPLLQDPVQAANAWPLRVTARRGIARMIRAAGRVDVIHLRMADVGSLAALEVARASNIPVVFTSAPDPHVLINTMDLSGRLTRENFGSVDETEHFWFRVNLLQRLVASSAHTVYFPRPNLQFDMRDLMGIDVAKAPGKHTTVPEGIDLSLTDEAVNEARRFSEGGTPSSALSELRELLQGSRPSGVGCHCC
ncbi:glycosyltransferase [Leucobacter coleopterorum]|uniref:Glycosyltransferase n=1 Tax=Leucobacter coleopterorum TaxID=2714933 RepID=A0ABX6K0Y4_9MICO|nr:HEAT repeat domain-containing protein [Leucobacter coleopterorum]QIM18907.1 glycosyltransferase [Leucobacter coleopterorum]